MIDEFRMCEYYKEDEYADYVPYIGSLFSI
jgi:hypothetical protein